MSQKEVQELTERIGTTLVSLICGAKQQFDVARWCEGELEMTHEQLERLRVTREVFDRVASSDGAKAARRWLTRPSTSNDQPDAPALAILVGRFSDARAHACSTIERVPL